jgi:hypothetical protein
MRSPCERSICKKMWGSRNPIRAAQGLTDARGVPFAKKNRAGRGAEPSMAYEP